MNHPHLSWLGHASRPGADWLGQDNRPDQASCGLPRAILPAVRKRVKPFHYSKICFEDSCLVTKILRTEVTWDVLRGVRSMCRLRTGNIVLWHRNFNRSQARIQSCIFCGNINADSYLLPSWSAVVSLVFGRPFSTYEAHQCA